MFEAEADVGIGGEMEDNIGAGHRPGEAGRVEQISLDQCERRVSTGFRDELRQSGGKVVVADDARDL